MQNELFDVFYNGQFLCRIIGPLVKSFVDLVNKTLPFDNPETSIVVRKVPLEEPKEEKAKK